MNFWFDHPNTYKSAGGLEYKTGDLSYTELASTLLALAAEVRRLESDLRAGTADLRSRRLSMIREGKELPGQDAFSDLPGWTDQIRSEMIALQNREADEAARRAGLLKRQAS